jgi:hypothetical protein
MRGSEVIMTFSFGEYPPAGRKLEQSPTDRRGCDLLALRYKHAQKTTTPERPLLFRRDFTCMLMRILYRELAGKTRNKFPTSLELRVLSGIK